MKRKTAIAFGLLSMLVLSVIPAYGRTMTEVITMDSVQIPHKLYKEAEIDSVFKAQYARYKNGLESYYAGDHWKISTPDTTLYLRDAAFWGLVKNDFSSFYSGQEIGEISELQRSTEKYVESYNAHRALMDDCIKFATTNQILIRPGTKMIECGLKYDAAGGMFYIPLNNDLMPVFDNKAYFYDTYKTAYPLIPIVKSDLINHFVKTDPRSNGWPNDYGPFLMLPINNKDIALKIEECQPVPRGCQTEFEIFYLAKIAEANTPETSHLVLSDILLVHTPTDQIVWSASEGDKSDEVILTK